MAYSDVSQSTDRRLVRFLELDVDYCQNTFGVSPCTATGTADAKCYNTYATCKDKPNFNPTEKTYRFAESVEGLNIEAFPCVRNISLSPSRIALGEPLSYNSSVNISLQDFPHHDRGTDPYVDERTYNPLERGTFFPKFKARNKYYLWRDLRILEGWVTDDGIDWDNFKTYNFLIDRISDPDPRGLVKITGRDVLRKLKDATVPKGNEFKLSEGIPAGSLSDEDANTLMQISGETSQATRRHKIGLALDEFYIARTDTLVTSVLDIIDKIDPESNNKISEAYARSRLKALLQDPIDETIIRINTVDITGGDHLTILYNNLVERSEINLTRVDTSFTIPVKASDGTEYTMSVPQAGIKVYVDGSNVSNIPLGTDEFEEGDEVRLLIGDEVIQATVQPDQLSFAVTERGVGGSETSIHDPDDKIQKCYWKNDVTIKEIIEDVLANYGGVPSGLVDFTSEEIETWMGNYKTSVTITEPEKVVDFLKEASESFLFDMWWSDGLQKVVMNPVAPLFSLTPKATLTDESSILRDSIKSNQDYINQITRFSISYNQIDITKYQDKEDFRKKYVAIDLAGESGFFYDRESYKDVLTRFVSDESTFSEVAIRWLARYNEGKTEIDLEVDPAIGYDLYVGDIVEFETYALTDASGNKLTTRGRIIERSHVSSNGRVMLKIAADPFGGISSRLIAPNGLSDWASEDGANEQLYFFICNDNNVFENGYYGHQLI